MAFRKTASNVAACLPRPTVYWCAGLMWMVVAALPAQAQTPTPPVTTPSPTPATTLPAVEVKGNRTEPAQQSAGVGGVSDAPVSQTPMSIGVIRSGALRDAGSSSLSGAMRAEGSVGDFYNTTGYVESLQIRGFLLDNALNYRRDGMAVSNHLLVPVENKESIEVLKGVAGLQSGTSAPGGLINYVLKRPTLSPLREVFFGLSERGTTLLHGDLGGRAGPDNQFGYRINAALEERRPEVRNAQGSRRFVSGFFDLRLPSRMLLEAEFEWQRNRQPSVPGFGLLDVDGNGVAETLPPPLDPRINLGAQPWAKPFESRHLIGSLRLQQALNDRWSWGAKTSSQRTRTNDRLAFPDGCSSGPNYLYPGFCGNYDFDVYDFRSENERRTMRTTELYMRGDFMTGGVRHELTFGVLQNRYAERYEDLQAYNFVGVGNVLNPVILPEDPTPTTLNTQRDTRTTELYVYDVMRFAQRWSVWAGVRHSILKRSSVRTDGTESTTYEQSFTTPWAAVGYQPWTGALIYASAGSGIESEVVPNRPGTFVNFGQVLPALRSRQQEIGYKQSLSGGGLFSAALFNITKPFSDDVPQGALVERVAGAREARHRGLELAWAGRVTPSLGLVTQATLLDAKTTRSLDPSTVGKRTPNTAPLTLSGALAWTIPGTPGIVWTNRATYSASKAVLRDGSVELPAWWQLDTWLTYRQKLEQTTLTWRAGVDNVFDRRYWRDAPTQYWGATYLFPALPRTFRVSVQASF